MEKLIEDAIIDDNEGKYMSYSNLNWITFFKFS